MAWTKKIKKTAGKVSTAAKKRYGIGKGRGGFKFTQVAKDLEMIKSRLNVEKKFFDKDLEALECGASDATAAGWAWMDATPYIGQGTGERQRVGNSIKATGMVIHLGAKGQINATKRRLKVMLVRSRTNDFVGGGGGILEDLFDPNPLTGNIDYFSNRNYTGSVASHKIIATKYVNVVPHIDSSTGMATAKIAVKLNDLIRYPTDGTSTPADFTYNIIVFCDYGNRNVSVSGAANTGLLEPGSQTGVVLNLATRMWYVDN